MYMHDCSTELRKVDLIATPARVAAMQLFELQTKPIDALFLVKTLAQQGIDRVTAFRIINTFVEKGLLKKIELREGKSRYELVSRGDHHHFVCISCDEITDIGKDTIMHNFIEKTERKYGITILDHSLEFFGMCPKHMGKEKN